MQSENSRLKEENAQLIAENSLFQNLQQEYLALQSETKLGNKENKKYEALITNFDPSGYLVVNLGYADGIKEDDIAVLGSIYVGRVVQVERNFSKIRTPLSQNSVLQIEVSPMFLENDSQEQLALTYQSVNKDVVHGVMSGTPNGIIVEDVLQRALVKRGDSVIVNDSKIGMLLMIGSVSEIDTDVAKADKQLSIDPVINYEELTYIYILEK